MKMGLLRLHRFAFVLLGATFVVGCPNPQPVQTVNQPPQITLASPEALPDNEPIPIEVGEGLTFEAIVDDAEDLKEDLVVHWIAERTDQGGVQSDLGDTTPDASGRTTKIVGGLEAGRYQITARVEDTRGATDETGLPVEIFTVNVAPTVLITQPQVGADFIEEDSVTFVGTATDDREPTSLSVEWFSDRDGPLNSAPPISSGLMTFSTDTLSNGEHTVTVRVTDVDGLFGEDAVVFEIIPKDLPPSTPIIEINPASPLSTEDLSCLITVGSADPDGEPITYTYSWFKNGVQALISSATLPATETASGEEWTCQVVANDGTLDSEPGEDTVTIDNQLPTIDSAVLGPALAFETSVLTCAGVNWQDNDGDPEGYQYLWLVDGSVVTGVTTATLDGTWFDRTQTVQCELTPDDGLGLGTPVLSNVITISNSAPTTPTISISPTPQADTDDDIVCQVDADSVDPDGDPFVYLVTWNLNGVYDATYDGQWTIPSATTSLGDTWECSVAGDDLEDIGVPALVSTTVLPDPGDFVVSEFLATPAAVTDPAGEWIELYNASGSTMNLNGFELHDDGTDSHVINADIVLPAGARVVLMRNLDVSTNGGVFGAYEYSGFTLSDTTDQVVLSFQGVEIDRFDYDLSNYSPPLTGRALAWDPGLGSPDPTLNDTASNWCGSSNPLTVPGSDFGTPGGVNDSCACYFSDGDLDGYGTDASCGYIDCDDNDPGFSPAAVDICEDSIDQNCDGLDAICPCLDTDSDGDQWGDGLGCATPDCNDANPFIYPGAPEICDGTDDNCSGTPDDDAAALMCPPTNGVVTTSCSSADCIITACSANLYDVDGDYSNGCEVTDVVVNSCGSAVDLGSVGNGGVSASGVANVPAAGGADWYVVDFPNGGRGPGNGTPNIALTRNDFNAYEFNLFPACGQGAICGSAQAFSFTDNADSSGAYNLNNSPWPSTVYIQVVRAIGGLTDGSYQLTLTR
ncbi:MAG: lamin tail domain-containing protein [Deltaproteobacteria bacterium]|nr:lamin tail domain-containing protein [Deltaproteobacteria bacterium]